MDGHIEKKVWIRIGRERIDIFTSFDKALMNYEEYSTCSIYEVTISERYMTYANNYLPFKIVEVTKLDIYKRLYEILKEDISISKGKDNTGIKGSG